MWVRIEWKIGGFSLFHVSGMSEIYGRVTLYLQNGTKETFKMDLIKEVIFDEDYYLVSRMDELK